MAKSNSEVSVKIYVEKIDKLVHSDENPRLIKSKRHKELIESLKQFPEMKLLREIVVDENLLILAGDKRTYALAEMGYTDVTIKQVIGLTDKQKREFIIKDNDHNGEWDTDIIANHWDINEIQDWGIKGFDPGAIGKEPKDPAAKDGQDRSHTCPGCGLEFED